MIGLHRALFAAGLLLPTSRGEQPAPIDPADHRAFADELTSLLYEQPNECSSALGVSMAFSLIYPGTVGEGREQIRDALGYPEGVNAHNQLVWEEETEALLEDSGGQCVQQGGGGDGCYSSAPLLKIANSVWLDDNSTLNAEYEDVVGDLVKQIDFESMDSPVIVNEWVENSTNGLIDSIVDEGEPLFPPFVLIAINSIYLKARWAEQFVDYNTNVDMFYDSSPNTNANTVSEAHFMHMVGYFPYSHEAIPGYQVIDLPFAESETLSMIFLLPQGEGGELVASSKVIPAVNDVKEQEMRRVALALPKFKFESKYDDNLMGALMMLNITDPFTEGTGALCGMFNDTTGCDRLIISKFVQKTVVDVNEEGVEAAAVTMAGVSLTSAGPTDENVPVKMILDHPFQFFIYDSSQDLVLFEGRVGAPEAPEGEKASLEAKHADSDFWSSRFGVDPEEPPVVIATPVLIGADGCTEEQCRNPNGICVPGTVVMCFADPCQVQSECEMKLCTPNYCGGCNHVCGTDPIVCPNGRDPIPDTFCGRGPSRADCGEGEFCHIHPTDLFAVCCPGSDGPEQPEEPIEVTVALSVNRTKHQMFADELTELLYENDNECSSALGVSMAFSLIYPGSTGEGIVEIRDTFRYPSGTNMALVWDEQTQRMLDMYDGEDQGYAVAPLLQIANSVWFDDDDALDPAYKSVVGEYAMQTNFKDVNSPAEINEWVEENTNGLIDSILPEGEALWPPYLLVAVNSIYLRATWNEQFQDYRTNQDTFYDSASRTTEASQAHFMHMVESFPYSHSALEGYQVIDLPFAASQMSMVFVLPTSDDLDVVSSTDLIRVLGSNALWSTRVALALPKFKFESEYDEILKDSLEDMGVEAPFAEGEGALCGLFEEKDGCEDIFVDKVVQKTVIDVNEEGVEAAAVTAIGVGVTSIPTGDPWLVVLDHPFQFFIYDRSEGLMLFEGRVGAPEVPEGATAAALESKHADEDFWSGTFGVDPVAPPVHETATGSTATAAGASTAVSVGDAGLGADATEPTKPAVSSDATQPTEAAVSFNATQPTEAAVSSNATQPTEVAVSSNATQPTETAVSPNTTQPTEAAGSSDTTKPTEAAVSTDTTQPTEAAPFDPSDPNSGVSDKGRFNLGACLFLASSLVYVW